VPKPMNRLTVFLLVLTAIAVLATVVVIVLLPSVPS
jgi:hypothetical protein